MPYSVEFESVSKAYPIYANPADRLLELILPSARRHHREHWALRDLSFTVRRGETFCIIGENGSGKSTTLQIIAGILRQTEGRVSIDGRCAALLELGSGFNPEFTGRDNVFLNAAILGLSRDQIEMRFPQIEAFAEIGEFLDQPVKTYSSGMLVRLAFSVAIHVDPTLLLVDEALAVGDIYFRQRCMRKVHELRKAGVTIIYVSHSIGDVKAIGDRVLWLEDGRARGCGSTTEIVPQYLANMANKDARYLASSVQMDSKTVGEENGQPDVIVTSIPNIDHRHGTGEASILGIAVLDRSATPTAILSANEEVIVRISARANEELSAPNIGFMLRNHLGLDLAGTNTTREGTTLAPMRSGDVITVDFLLSLPQLYPGAFSFSPAIANGDLTTYEICDWVDNAITLQMSPSKYPVYGYVHLPAKVSVNGRPAISTEEAESLLD